MILLKKCFLTLVAALTTVMSGAQTDAPAFPGAEGHGRYVTGGRGAAEVIHVTNLNNSGTGSFRSAVSGSTKKIIVFDVGGVIPLASDVTIGANTTILGQTAPYPGITLRYYTVRPNGNNIIMRFIRIRRGEEKNGVEYFFLTPEEFRQKIANDEFVEYEEVYTDKFYGTLKSQVDKQLAAGENVIFDVDVNGAMNIKKIYGNRALSIFIQPPSIEELRHRLEKRATDAPEVIEQRIERAKYELSQAEHFDEVVINDNLEIAQVEARALVEDFLEE